MSVQSVNFSVSALSKCLGLPSTLLVLIGSIIILGSFMILTSLFHVSQLSACFECCENTDDSGSGMLNAWKVRRRCVCALYAILFPLLKGVGHRERVNGLRGLFRT